MENANTASRFARTKPCVLFLQGSKKQTEEDTAAAEERGVDLRVPEKALPKYILMEG